MNQQEWLVQLTEKLKPLFEAADHPLPLLILKTDDIQSLSAAYFDKANLAWVITLSDEISSKIEVAETLIHNLVFRAIPFGETGRADLAALVGYSRTRPVGDKLAFCLKRIVEAMPPYPPQVTREAWLTRLVDELRPLFDDVGRPLPVLIDAAPGWFEHDLPKNGACQFATGRFFIYLWPHMTKPITVALALVKQLVVCAVGFASPAITTKAVYTRIGLNGQLASETEPTAALIFLLNSIIADLGPYPEN